MKYTHDEIREMLPDYLNGILEKTICTDIETHLKGCPECKDEVSFISELQKTKVPEPGELFWNTLPQKLSRIVAEKRQRRGLFDWLLRPAPAMVSVLLFMALVLSYLYIKSTDTNGIDPLFEDPLAYSSIEINDITEEDVLAFLAEEIGSESTEIYLEDTDPYSYYMDFASLSSAEIKSLYEALEREQTKGG